MESLRELFLEREDGLAKIGNFGDDKARFLLMLM